MGADVGTLVEGEGRVTGPLTVTVGDTAHTGTHLVLASGSSARSLPGLEVDGVRVLTSDHALRLDRVPSSAIVLGGGVLDALQDDMLAIIEATGPLTNAAPTSGAVGRERSSRRRLAS